MIYTKEYFIEKFEAIPEAYWCVGVFFDGDKCCAAGHCGMGNGKVTAESESLCRLITNHLGKDTTEYTSSISTVNDKGDSRFQQDTPKQRVLAALRSIE